MSDKPDLLVPDRRVVSLDEAKREREIPRTSQGSGSDFVTRKELIKILDNVGHGIGDASRMVGQQVFDQVAQETSELLERMHHNIIAEMRAEFYNRSWRGRRDRFLARMRDWLVTLHMLSPIVSKPELVVDASAALDPVVQREAGLAKLRELIAGATMNTAIELPEGTTLDDAKEIEAQIRAEREQALENEMDDDESLE